MNKTKLAYDAWKAATAAAKSAADAMIGIDPTDDQCKALNDLIDLAAKRKDDYQRIKALEEMEAETSAEFVGVGRKTVNAPAVVTGRTSTNAPLWVSNIYKGVFAAQGSAHRGAQEQFAKEEFDFSDRLKAAGYRAESMGGVLFPLGDEWLIDPVDANGVKTGDFSEFRKELKERLPLFADRGEVARIVRGNEMLSSAFGLDRKDMSIGDDSLGGMLVPATQSGRVIDFLRARSVLVRAGATEVPLPASGNFNYPRFNSDPEFTYTDIDTTTDLATTQPGTGVVRLIAKSLRGAVTIPNDLIRYSSPALEMIVRMILAAKSAVAEDKAFLENPGSSVAPKGILFYPTSTAETPTTGSVTLHVASTVGSNGNTLEPEDIALIQALFEEGNDIDSATGWILRPLFSAAIRNKRADAISAGDKKGPFVFDLTRSMAMGAPSMLGDVPVYTTTNLSRNRVKGSGTTLHALLYGNFRRMIIGRVGAVELAVSEHVKFLQDKTVIRAILRSDMGLEHEESFVLTDTLLQA